MDHFAKSQNLLLNDLFCIGKVYTLYLPHKTNNMTAAQTFFMWAYDFFLIAATVMITAMGITIIRDIRKQSKKK